MMGLTVVEDGSMEVDASHIVPSFEVWKSEAAVENNDILGHREKGKKII